MAKSSIRVLLLDIEGTTTPVDFVHRTLFPFARKHLHEFLLREGKGSEVRSLMAALRAERELDVHDLQDPPAWSESEDAIESATRYALWLMDRDRKSTALKWLQGKIWEEGYLSGELRSTVYEDVPKTLNQWQSEGRTIAIYSSGSILAQKLLFAHTNAGDLTSFISFYFDTTTGPKTEADSYRAIAGAIGVAPGEILFYSDVTAEVDAARVAGMLTALCVREGEAPEPNDHPIIRSFDSEREDSREGREEREKTRR